MLDACDHGDATNYVRVLQYNILRKRFESHQNPTCNFYVGTSSTKIITHASTLKSSRASTNIINSPFDYLATSYLQESLSPTYLLIYGVRSLHSVRWVSSWVIVTQRAALNDVPRYLPFIFVSLVPSISQRKFV